MRCGRAAVINVRVATRIGALRSLTGRPRGNAMNALTPASLVHFYDTRSRAIVCGVRGYDHRSTKHSRQVTCQACVGILRERPSLAAASRSDNAAGAAP